MSILVSPGVDVQIIDESFYGSAGAGTVPLIVVATATNKLMPGGTGIAPQTTPERAGQLYLATSQRDLVQAFGNPAFKTVQGTSQHGHELNEYGLHAAYQYLGIANRAYILRADIDLAQLEPSDTPPKGAALAGTYWLDTASTEWGVFRSNGAAVAGSAWKHQVVKVAYEADTTLDSGSHIYVPNTGFGVNGDYAVSVAATDNRLFEKIAGAWLEVGTANWNAAHPTVVTGTASPALVGTTSTITINGHTIALSVGTGTLANVVSAINGALGEVEPITADDSTGALRLTNTAGGQIVIANGAGTPLATLGITAGTYNGVSVIRTSDAHYPAHSVDGDIWVKGTTPNLGANWKVKFFSSATDAWVNLTAAFYPYDSSKNDGDPSKDLAAFAAMGVPTAGVVYVGYDTAAGVQVLRRWSGVQWEDLVYEAATEAPYTPPEAGTLWYSSDFKVDIMVGDGVHWNGYRRRYPNTDPHGVILAGSPPVTQSDGTPLVENDLWIDLTDLEAYPALYRFNATTLRWRRVDTTDQTTPFGIVFADARQNSGVDFVGNPSFHMVNTDRVLNYATNSEKHADLLASDYLDPDAPDARLHPDGTLLFNTRFSTYNVKEWLPTYFLQGGFDPNTSYIEDDYTVGDDAYVFPALDLTNVGRWVTKSANRFDGAPYMGRKAQRILIIRAMAKALAENDDLRSEMIFYNLMTAPGYHELVDELISCNTDQKELAFIIGDSPARLLPNNIEAWATNNKNVPSTDDDGLTASNIYVGVYYPWGLSTNVDGSEVMVPPSTMALRTFAYNDQVAYPWFAPAGFQRGLISNATSVGYLTTENEYRPVFLSQGQRDVMYINSVNPITFIPGRGLVLYGQKTRSPLSSALDRINVARLANYLKYTLDLLMKPFLFEPNDEYTRAAVKKATERFLTNLMTLRALYDFAVLCDETNNTPERIDRNELWVDCLVKPEKAIEFIYVPVRIENTGATLTH